MIDDSDRTVAHLRADGYIGLEIRCNGGCGHTVVTFWNLMPVRGDEPLPHVLARLKCERCGARPGVEDVTLWRRGDEHGRRDQAADEGPPE